MRVKLAAKLLVIAWTLMKKKELFDPIGRRVPRVYPWVNASRSEAKAYRRTGQAKLALR